MFPNCGQGHVTYICRVGLAHNLGVPICSAITFHLVLMGGPSQQKVMSVNYGRLQGIHFLSNHLLAMHKTRVTISF